MQAASKRILTSKSSNCSTTSSHRDLPERVSFTEKIQVSHWQMHEWKQVTPCPYLYEYVFKLCTHPPQLAALQIIPPPFRSTGKRKKDGHAVNQKLKQCDAAAVEDHTCAIQRKMVSQDTSQDTISTPTSWRDQPLLLGIRGPSVHDTGVCEGGRWIENS